MVIDNKIRICCAADLHLGRTLTYLPEGIIASPIVTWQKIVEWAVSNQVDAVLLAGDLIDSEEDFFEAFVPLKEGLEKLLAAKIPVVAVGGNHDYAILERLHRSLPSENFYLIGVGGKWERVELNLQGKGIVIDGWSFPSSHYNQSPFKSYQFEKAKFQIGLIHGDALASESEYAPLLRNEMRALPHRAWVLGHCHVPQILENDPLIFYCGSPQGLDVSEKGEHGVRLLEIDHQMTSKLIPLAELFWDQVIVDVTGLDREDFEGSLIKQVDQHIKELSAASVGLRCILKGRCNFYRELSLLKESLTGKIISNRSEGHLVFIESVDLHVQPDFDLNSLKQGNDAIALLAQELDGDVGQMSLEALLKEYPHFDLLDSFDQNELEEIANEVRYELIDQLIEQRKEQL